MALRKKAQKCRLVRSSKEYLDIGAGIKEAREYPIDDADAIRQLVASQRGKHKFKYDFEYNKAHNKIKLFIAPSALMNGRLGVYADQDIKKSKKPIGRYAGKRSKYAGDIHGLYTFQITDKNDKITEYIHADKFRDWSAFINSSTTPNLFPDQKKVNGVEHMYFYLGRDIKKGEQLLYDYGDYYFNDPKIKPFYIHSSDNWLTPDDRYLQYKPFYARGKFKLDKLSAEKLHLNFPGVKDFLVPEIFLSVYKNDAAKLKKQLKKSYPVDLLAYACEGKKICPNHKQQHMTALMFACFLGHSKPIKTLIDAGADVDRCMLISGYSSFTSLMLGYGDQETVEEIGMQLLRNMNYVSVYDHYRLSILHYAIMRQSTKLVGAILKIFSKEDFDWLELIYDREKHFPQHADFDYCLKHGYFDMLTLMLKTAIKDFGKQKDGLIHHIEKGYIFSPKALSTVPLEYLQQLEKLLQKPAFRLIQKKSVVLDRVRRIIKRKSC